MDRQNYMPRIIDRQVGETRPPLARSASRGRSGAERRGLPLTIAEAKSILAILPAIFRTGSWQNSPLRWYWKAKHPV